MATCKRCRRSISGPDQRKAHLEKREGKVVGIYHNKCWHIEQKKLRPGVNERGRFFDETPTAYDMATGTGVKRREDMAPEETEKRRRAEEEYARLKARQKEIAEQRELEEVPSAWNDWREPEEMTLEELNEAAEKLRSTDS